ncbi:protein Rf1, mitochondrial-like [Canna indica]|uniref:Protein Rf1, mitochondrial-like n=1 Tax=Canna indica TaxID=4628 RepID=A0AAQ3Q4Q1_9LILI|nr:protein Rf1, mitochondrial-like [Canna indica]
MGMFQDIILSHNKALDVGSFDILVDGWSGTGKVDAAGDLLNAVPTKDLKPNVITYTIIVKGLIREGLFDEADKLLLLMENNGCSADSRMLNVVIQSLLEKEEVSTVSIAISLFSKDGKSNDHFELLPKFFQDYCGL